MSTKQLPFDWVISDTHWGHKNINKYCWRTTPAYPTPEAVDGLMEYNWKALVKPDDRILHLGDLCFWGDGRELPMLRELPGDKFLLRGNHDLYPDDWYRDHGFSIVGQDEVKFLFAHELGTAMVVMSHYPETLDADMVNVHGHVHNNPHPSTPNHINVSVELTSFAPVQLDKVLEKVMWHHTKQGSGKNNGKKARR